MNRQISATIRLDFDFTEMIEQMIDDNGSMTNREIRNYIVEDLADGSAIGECLRRGRSQYIKVKISKNHE